MKKILILLLVLCLFPMGWASADAKPGSYAKAYELFSNLSTAMNNAFEEVVGTHNDDLEYDDPTNLSLILFMPFLSLDMAFTNMLDEQVEDHVVQMVFSMFGMEDVAFSKLAPHQYMITYTRTDEDDASKQVEMYCEFSPDTGAIRYSRHDDGVVADFQELVPLGGDRYAMQNGSQRAVLSYAGGTADTFAFSSAGGQSLFGGVELVYDFYSESIYPSAFGLDEAWVMANENLRLSIKLDASGLSVKGTDLFGAEKDVVIPR